MGELPWETELRESTRTELEALCAPAIRPTTDEECREFVKLAQLGYISLSFDSRIDKIPWIGFPGRLAADRIRLQVRYDSLWTRFEEQDRVQAKMGRELARLKAKKGQKKDKATND